MNHERGESGPLTLCWRDAIKQLKAAEVCKTILVPEKRLKKG